MSARSGAGGALAFLPTEKFFTGPPGTSEGASPSWRQPQQVVRDSQDGPADKRAAASPNQFAQYYYTLAPASSDDSDQESEGCSSSVYDSSIHNRDTDFCHDTDDDSSSEEESTVSDATMPAEREVVEYDVVSASSDGPCLYVEDSSSGTDNYIIDKRIIILQEQAKRSLNGDCSTTSSNTSSSGTASEYSQSDSTDEDPELKPADYWKCVKCKNSQNNPLYRYCEKCYQLRKNYFPPRPRNSSKRRPEKLLRRRRQPRSEGSPRSHHHHHNRPSSSSNLTSTDDEEAEEQEKSPKRTRNSSGADQASSSSKNMGNLLMVRTATQSSSAVSSGEEVGVGGDLANGASGGGTGSGTVTASGPRSVQSVISEDSGEEGRKKRKHSSQTTTTEERKGDEEGSMLKKVKLTISDGEGSSGIGGDSQEEIRPKSLNLASVLLRGLAFESSSGCSSYSSGQESLPSPTSTQEEVGGGLTHVVSSLAAAPMTVSLSREGSQSLLGDKLCYSDSETYNRTSSKCVVNKGEAHAIIKRLQGELLSVREEAKEEREQHQVEKEEGEQKQQHTEEAAKSAKDQHEEEERLNNLCIICVNAPKDSAFVHSRVLHISCCYKCAIKVWNKNKRCPICNCKVKNVLKCYVH